jgi:hypothetical protein
MAKANVPQADARDQAGGDVTKTLKEVDWLVQRAADSIRAIANGAKKLLEMDVNSLVAVASLLDQIDYLACDVSDNVTSEAERHGASSFEKSSLDLWSKLHKQKEALQSANLVEAVTNV